VLYERSERKTSEAVVSLTEENVVGWRHVEGVQSPITFEEFMACEAAVQADPGWQEAMRKRGMEDFSLAMIDPWAASYLGEEDGGCAPAANDSV
jgi:primary-amine oxidase